MNYLAKQTFIEDHLKQLWPQWKWPEAALGIWLSVLSHYDFEEAKTAVNQVYTVGRIKYQRQLVPAFIEALKLKKYSKGKHRICSMVWTKYQVICIEGKRKGFTKTACHKREFAGNDIAEQQEANKLLNFFKDRYGGEWIIKRRDEPLGENHKERTGIAEADNMFQEELPYDKRN